MTSSIQRWPRRSTKSSTPRPLRRKGLRRWRGGVRTTRLRGQYRWALGRRALVFALDVDGDLSGVDLRQERDRDVTDALGADLIAANFSPAHHDVALNVEIGHGLAKVRTL